MDEEKFERQLFDSLDSNHDGLLDQADLTTSLPTKSPLRLQFMQDWLANNDDNRDGKVDFSEFHNHIHTELPELRKIFDAVDANRDGKLDFAEVKDALENLYGVTVSSKSTSAMLNRMDLDKDGFISFQEWATYLVFLPVHDGYILRHIFDAWKEDSFSDSGDGITVPSLQVTSQFATLVAGGCAGAVSRTVTAPLDRLKTLIQIHGTKQAYSGIAAGLIHIWKEGGMSAFFRGNLANCLKIAPETATKFFAYEYFKTQIFAVFGDRHPILQKFVAGASAGVVSQVLVYPLDSVKARMALSPVPIALPQACKNTYACGGAPAFYRGIQPCVIGVIPYAGIDLAIYETLKTLFTEYSIQNMPVRANTQNLTAQQFSTVHSLQPTALSMLIPLACGTISSTIAQFFAYPFALVRTKLQTQGMHADKYTGMIDAFQQTVQKDGVKGLYKGMGPNLLKVVPAMGISYVVYEKLRSLMLSARM